MRRTKRIASFVLAAALVTPLVGACKKKVTQAQCDELVDRFASLVVKERIKDAAPEVIKAEQERERNEAKSDEAFRNCTSEVAMDDYTCAMATTTSDAFLKCLD